MHKLKHGQFHLNIRRYISPVIEVKHLRNRLASKFFESLFLEMVQSWATCHTRPSLQQGYGLGTSTGLEILCDYLIFFLFKITKDSISIEYSLQLNLVRIIPV